ncbi:MAG: transcription elongation factor GreA [Candidatus Gracilibacteria bacterium]|nr:transcription elongation factor GreA [Candidatus Gracilibacteria bacterium]
MIDNKVYVTQEGLEKLKEEFEHLKTIKRVEIAEKLKEAISFGDLSENSEYEEARSEQAQVEKRILDLDEQLKNIVLIDESESKGNKIKIGAVVTISPKENPKEEVSYKIVGSTEADILAELPKISNESPIGKALIGKKVGDNVKVKSQSGTYEYKIIEMK